MAIVCPAILAENDEQYHKEMAKVAHFARRIQIDLTDGQFARATTIKPERAWWPVGIKADFHLMYKDPLPAFKIIKEHRPNLVIAHAEADGDFATFANICRGSQIAVGIALLQNTPADTILPIISQLDHVLIFSGELGKYGGHVNFGLLEKIKELKRRKPDLEIGWDGGINDQNISQLVSGGVDVLNVGGFLQNSTDPTKTFESLQRIADETGET